MITIVSGLPRSGTSLTMQMCKAAGFPIHWNREPNFGPANPKGYYEWTEAKDLNISTREKLYSVEGKFVKLFPHVWPCLTHEHEYRFIYIDRPLNQVRESQVRMLELENRMDDLPDEEAHMAALLQLRFLAGIYLRAFPSVTVKFDELFTGAGAFKICRFLGGAQAQWVIMDSCVDPALKHFGTIPYKPTVLQ